jgi:hypothetical protein
VFTVCIRKLILDNFKGDARHVDDLSSRLRLRLIAVHPPARWRGAGAAGRGNGEAIDSIDTESVHEPALKGDRESIQTGNPAFVNGVNRILE